MPDDQPADQPDGEPDDRYPHRARDARWVDEARAGDERAFGRLYDAWFDKVYGIALGIVRQPEVAAEVSQDAFLAAWSGLASLDDPRAFGGWLLRITRNGALNRRAREQRSSPVDEAGIAVIEATGASPSNAPAGFGVEDRLGRLDDPAQVAAQSELQDLVWSAVGALGERDGEVLDLQLRYGLSPAEIGEVMGLNRNAANQLVHRVRGRLAEAVRARVLWRGDRPACDTLAALLAAVGGGGFDAEAVKIAERHAPSCSMCSERRDLHLQPAAMFAAVPLIAAPILFKQQVAGAMEMAGVPMQGSAFSAGGAASSGAGFESGSGESGGSGGESGGSGPSGTSGTSGTRRGARVLSMAMVVLVVLVAAVALFAADSRDPDVPEAAIGTTALPSTPLSVPGESTTTTAVETATSVTTVARTSAPPPSTTTSRVPDPIVASIALSASSISSNGGEAPILTWSVTGGGTWSVSVTGPSVDRGAAVPSAAPSGSGLVCPGRLVQISCYPPYPTPFDYTLTVRAPDGTVLVARTITLDVN